MNSKNSETSKTVAVTTNAAVGTTNTPVLGESLVQPTLKNTMIDRPYLTSKPVLESSISVAGSTNAVHIPAFTENNTGKVGSNQEIGFFPRTSSTSTTLYPTFSTSQLQFGGENRMFSNTKMFQGAEEGYFMTSSSNSNSKTPQLSNVKIESSQGAFHFVPTQREDIQAKDTARHGTKHIKGAKTPLVHSSKKNI